MNVLAHLHIASIANSSIIGNIGADFIKGDPYKQFNATIADGIMLHRRLDHLIDHITQVKQAKLLFIPEHQRVAPITLDIIWDHFLSLHWHDPQLQPHHIHTEIVQKSVAQFNSETQNIIKQDITLFPNEFADFMAHLWQYHWLENYADVDFIARVLNGMANRYPKLSMLRHTFADFKAHYNDFEQLFFQFYPELITQAEQQIL